jgi:hypothetical protein
METCSICHGTQADHDSGMLGGLRTEFLHEFTPAVVASNVIREELDELYKTIRPWPTIPKRDDE